MAKMSLKVLQEIEPQVIDVPDETASLDTRTRTAFSATAPIQLRMYELPESATVEWSESRSDHLTYIWSGAVRVAGRRLGAGSVLVVEHRASPN
jgi:hypothetical protein